MKIVDIDNMTYREEQVQDFLINKLDNWIHDATSDGEDKELIEMARLTQLRIHQGRAISKKKAEWLETLLSDHLNREIASHAEYRQHMNPMLSVDSWMIYTDAYTKYCRPGAYTV